jgi:ATP-dependent DNA helicase RecG
VLILPGGKANLDFVRLVVEEHQANRLLSLDDLLILNHLLERQISTEEAARLIQKPESEARARLQRLVEGGLVELRGERRGRMWHLSAATYRRLGQRAGYIRQRGFEPLQQEQMVLQYVEQHGSITRSEVAELCRLNPAQAYRLLKKLEMAGKIRRVVGSTKGTRYGLPKT